MDSLPPEILICEIIEKNIIKPKDIDSLSRVSKRFNACVKKTKQWKIYSLFTKEITYEQILTKPSYVFRWFYKKIPKFEGYFKYNRNIFMRQVCRNGNVDLLSYFYEHNMIVDKKMYRCIFIDACYGGKINIVKYLVEEIRIVNKSSVAYNNYCAIRIARIKRRYSGVDRYLKKKFNIGNIGTDPHFDAHRACFMYDLRI